MNNQDWQKMLQRADLAGNTGVEDNSSVLSTENEISPAIIEDLNTPTSIEATTEKIIDRDSIAIFEESLFHIVDKIRQILELSSGMRMKESAGVNTASDLRLMNSKRITYESGRLQSEIKSESEKIVKDLHEIVKSLAIDGKKEDIVKIKKCALETLAGLKNSVIYQGAESSAMELFADFKHDLLNQFIVLKTIKEIDNIGKLKQAFAEHARVEKAKLPKDNSEQIVVPIKDEPIEVPQLVKPINEDGPLSVKIEKTPTIGELPLKSNQTIIEPEVSTGTIPEIGEVFKTPQNPNEIVEEGLLPVEKSQSASQISDSVDKQSFTIDSPKTESPVIDAAVDGQQLENPIGIEHTEQSVLAAKSKALGTANDEPAVAGSGQTLDTTIAMASGSLDIPESNSAREGLLSRLSSFFKGNKIKTTKDASILSAEEALRAGSEK